MSVGTAAGIAIAMGAAGAATSVYGANKAAGASKSAAAQQQAATTQAQAFNQQAWQAQQAALKPYQMAGQYALQNLQQKQLGPGGVQSQNAGSLGIQNAPGWQNGAFSLANLGRPGPAGGPQGPPQQPQMAMGGQPGMQQPGGGGMQERGPEQGGGMVTVTDDSGATRQVPRAQAQLYAQRGFKVMG
jgi:hypothetical protein